MILSKLYAQKNDLKKALKLLQTAIKNNPYNGEVNYTIAHVYKELGDTEQYQYHLKEAMNNYETLSTDLKQLQFELKSFE